MSVGEKCSGGGQAIQVRGKDLAPVDAGLVLVVVVDQENDDVGLFGSGPGASAAVAQGSTRASPVPVVVRAVVLRVEAVRGAEALRVAVVRAEIAVSAERRFLRELSGPS